MSLALNALLIYGLYTGYMAARQSALQAVDFATQEVGNWRKITFEHTVRIDDSVPINLNVPISQTVVVPISTTLPVNTQVQVAVNVPVIGTQVVRIPISTTIPVRLEAQVPINLNVPVAADIPVKMEVPIKIALSETPADGYLMQAEDGLRKLAFDLEELDLNGLIERVSARTP